MKLLDVTLSGFKSFARKTTFEFSDGLTAVVGPNGSGKSNLTEGIRWVLGEQSLKSLRGKKSDDVIFAGNAKHARSGHASVTLTLSNESGRLAIDAAEVALTRRLDRSGESEYTINGDPVRLLDIHQLLADAGLGTKSYTVISQGTVDRYLNATPSGRRELFDEATGIKSLQLKVAQAERKLAQADREIHELETILQELTPRLRVLKRQLVRHEERGQLEKDYAHKLGQWLAHTWHARTTEYNLAAARLSEAQTQIQVARKRRQQTEAALLQHVAETADSPQPSEQRLAQQLAQAQQDYLQATQLYETQVQQREELSVSLTAIREQRQKAELQLSRARDELKPDDLFTSMRHVLERCQTLLTTLQTQHTLDAAEIEQVTQEITQLLQDSEHEALALGTAESLVARLSGPLQAVARAQAIEQERQNRLEQLPVPTPPSLEVVEHLRQQVAESPTPGVSHKDELTHALDEAHSSEVAAERAGSAAETQLTYARENVAEIEREILREKGSAFLETIRHSAPEHAVHQPSREELDLLQARLGALGEIDPLALKEYDEVATRVAHLEEQLTDITATKSKMATLQRSLAAQIQTQFREQFTVIADAFSTYFIRLFEGGNAKLELVEMTEAPAEEEGEVASVQGVEIMVNPPGKKPQHIGLLSGGEKALTSLALLLAILDVQQPPFLVLDEVDAALDEANSHRFAQLLKEKSAATQCIVISHNRETMAEADILYGITMQQDGISKAYSVKLSDIAETAVGAEMTI